MKRDIVRPTKVINGKEEVVYSKGTLLAYLLIGITLALITLVTWAMFSILHLGKMVFIISACVVFLVFILLIFIECNNLCDNILFYWHYLIYKRIYGREGGKPSRLTKEERWDVSWETTIRLLEEKAEIPDSISEALEEVYKNPGGFPKF